MNIIEKIQSISIEDRINIIRCYEPVYRFGIQLDKHGKVVYDTMKWFDMLDELVGLREPNLDSFYRKYGIPNTTVYNDTIRETNVGDAVIYLIKKSLEY